MRRSLRLAFWAVLACLYLALGWIAGLGLLVVWFFRWVRAFVRMRRAVAPTIRCTWCRARVPQYGPYLCGHCHARTLGWAWRCGACGAWAGHVECPSCGMSVSNPILGAP
jgi:hypothetical protein